MEDTIQLFKNQIKLAKETDDITDYFSIISHFPPYVYHHFQYLYYYGDVYDYFLKMSQKNEYLYLLNKQIGGYKYKLISKNREVEGYFYIQRTSIENMYLIHSISYSFGWSLFKKKILENRYPKIVLLYWKQSELTKAINVLEKSQQSIYKLTVKELSITERREDTGIDKGKQKDRRSREYDSIREWTSKDLSQVLDEAIERDQWFKKMKFQLFRKIKDRVSSFPSATCNISKFGYISFDNLYPIFFSVLLKELEPPFGRKIALFKDKGLKERNYKPSIPLAIEYKREIFNEKDNVEYFRDVIQKYPNSTKAFFHTNPYFHVSLADFKDGSSFNIWISNPKRILIIPQIKTSVEGLERLIAFIFDNFQEGTIKENI